MVPKTERGRAMLVLGGATALQVPLLLFPLTQLVLGGPLVLLLGPVELLAMMLTGLHPTGGARVMAWTVVLTLCLTSLSWAAILAAKPWRSSMRVLALLLCVAPLCNLLWAVTCPDLILRILAPNGLWTIL
ncbi:MAG: hypothetical protein KC656_23500 [Myxococcales bacterium]|nr:hypothetical protein [Myxococcales bacterium]MCA9570835.1 hypothetical protein [Myxococcales bacterium]